MPPRTRWMRDLLTFVGLADLVVTVDGWMMHAAYLAGRPLRILAAPRAHIEDWLPYGMSAEQRLQLSGVPRCVILGTLDREPVLSQPWQFHLTDLLVACEGIQSQMVKRTLKFYQTSLAEQ
jgi:hypothetical protein